MLTPNTRSGTLKRLISSITMITVFISGSAWGEEIKLSALDLSDMTQGWGAPGINTSVGGKVLSIGGQNFVSGVGTHAPAALTLDLAGAAKRFTAQVGIDDETGGKGTVEFEVVGDGKSLWMSSVIKGGAAATAVDVDLAGVKTLILRVSEARDGEGNDHADWANASITYHGTAPSAPPHSIPHIFGDNMVLQREKPVPVWGWAKAGQAVTVSFTNQVKKTTADKSGNWMVRLDAMPANKSGQDLTIRAADTVVFKNVLVGEVWICSGQSNMEFGVNSVLNANEEVKSANPLIRFIKVPKYCYSSLRPDFNQSPWQVSTPSTVGGCTAVGYFFARELVKELDVPVGLIGSNWSGTSIEPWLNREGLAAIPELSNLSKQANDGSPDSEAGQKRTQDYQAKLKEWLSLAEKAQGAKQPLPAPPIAPPGMAGNSGMLTHIYNGLINPLVPFAMRGTIWYQGESNGQEGDTYVSKMKALVGGWRHVWKQGDFPFYWVQLANFQPSDPNKPEMGDGWAKLREAQLKALSIPNSGMAVNIDVGDPDIHPKNKQDVGKRLAAWALAKDYGKKIEYSGPLYLQSKVEGSTMRITFDHAGSGLMLGDKTTLDAVKTIPGDKLTWISIAGEDQKFYWADAKLDGNTLVVSSGQVPKPVAVRYAFTMNPVGTKLYNKEGFPASPFRTDSWPIK